MDIYKMEKIIACVNYESKQFASHLVQFAHTTCSILISFFFINREHNSVEQCSGRLALQTQAGPKLDPSHMISWGSRLDRTEI